MSQFFKDIDDNLCILSSIENAAFIKQEEFEVLPFSFKRLKNLDRNPQTVKWLKENCETSFMEKLKI